MKHYVGLLLVGALLAGLATAADETERPRNRFETDILVETFGYDESTPGKVPFAELYQGCPARDCIPAIDQPKFVAATEADFLQDDDLVMALEINGDARAYPALILNFHEIVNDRIGGEPVAVTFCPLCGSGVAFDRRMDGREVAFGVSGVLHDSDLVMYDRHTNTLWQQISGEAIMGPKLGESLTMVPMTMVEWGAWRKAHPDTKVLSTDTGHDMDYKRAPYGDYTSSEKIYFPVANSSMALHPKAVVHGIEVDGQSLAVVDQMMQEKRKTEITVGERKLSIVMADDGSVEAVDKATGERFAGMRLFWFAWYNFHTDTRVVDGADT